MYAQTVFFYRKNDYLECTHDMYLLLAAHVAVDKVSRSLTTIGYERCAALSHRTNQTPCWAAASAHPPAVLQVRTAVLMRARPSSISGSPPSSSFTSNRAGVRHQTRQAFREGGGMKTPTSATHTVRQGETKNNKLERKKQKTT